MGRKLKQNKDSRQRSLFRSKNSKTRIEKKKAIEFLISKPRGFCKNHFERRNSLEDNP
jgi:hypothetical protein